MRAFLASRVSNPNSISALQSWIPNFSDKSISYIVTAANGEGYGSWKNTATIDLIQSLNSHITFYQLEDYAASQLPPEITKADILWVGGGMTGYLLYWIYRTQMDRLITDFLQSDSGYYVGSSTGAMILGQTDDSAEWPEFDCELGASIIPPLKILPFDIIPHTTQEKLEAIKKYSLRVPTYMIADGQHIVISGESTQYDGILLQP